MKETKKEEKENKIKRRKQRTDKTTFVYDEPARERIYYWAKARFKRNQSIFINHAKLYFITREIISNLSEHFNLVSIIHLAICVSFSVLCLKYDIRYHLPGIFYLLIFSLSVSFLIDADFTRRESALNHHAELRSHCASTFLISRAWRQILMVDDAYYESIKNLLVRILIHINEYLQTSSEENRTIISSVVYEDLNDLSIHMEKYGLDKQGLSLDTHTPIIWYIASRINFSFERLKVIREYRSPFTQRSFTKIYAFFLPLLFAPWFAYMSKDSTPPYHWLSVLYNGLFAFIVNGQTIITDRLFDPFISLSSDQIDLTQTFSWIDYAIFKIENRKYVPFDYTPPIPCGKSFDCSNPDRDDKSIYFEMYQPFKVMIRNVYLKGKERVYMDIVKPGEKS